MKSTKRRALMGLAVVFMLTPALLHAEGTAPVLGDLYSAPALGGAHSLVQVDDLVAMNRDGIGRRGVSTDEATSPTTTTVELAAASDVLEPLPAAAEVHWILGAFGAVFVMGLGITFAGIYWAGPRSFTRTRSNW